MSNACEVATTFLLAGAEECLAARPAAGCMHPGGEPQRCRQSGAVGSVRMIGSGSATSQTQKQALHSYISRIGATRTGWPFSCRHLGQMASGGGSGAYG